MKIIYFFLFLSLLSCGSSKVPIGYKNLNIHLGDKLEQIENKIGNLNEDPNGISDLDSNLEDYYKIDDAIYIKGLEITPTINLTINPNYGLISFSITYIIGDAKYEDRSFEDIFNELARREIPGINELILINEISLVNHDKLYMKSYSTKKTSGIYPTIKYSIHAIP